MTRHENMKQQAAALREKAKKLYRDGMSQADIARHLHVSKQYINQIVSSGRTRNQGRRITQG